MKILVVGDLHRNWEKINELIDIQKPDIVLQCGDFGWWKSLEKLESNWKLKGIKSGNTKIYFCDGNHEEHPLLTQDGTIQEMYKNIYFCSRGSTLTLPDNRIVLFAGGAYSVDENSRIMCHDWFREENINNSDFDKMISHEKIDIVISHTCPKSFEISNLFNGKTRDSNRIALQNVLEKYEPKLWFFGHWHKFYKGEINRTSWTCLDYPGHGGKWWIKL